jgi:long-chain acyl-CoA synthetase
MRRKLAGIKRQAIELDFDLYRVAVPLPAMPGQNLSVIDMQPEGVDQTIVFVHGFAGCAETWEFQINHFAKRYRVVVPDLRGHGQSDAPYSDYTMPEIVADLHAMVEHLALPDKVVLVGHSFGGSICVEYVTAHPERIAKLVLIASAGEYPLPRAASVMFRLPSALYQPFWRYRPRWNAELHVMKRMMLNNLRKWRGWPLLRNIQTETLVITGERDNFFPRAVFDDVARLMPNAEVVDIGTAKHKVQLERHQSVNRAIERFIEDEQRRGGWRTQHTTDDLVTRRPWVRSYSAGTPHTIPIPRQPLHKFLESAAEWLPKRPATVFNGHTLTYGQLNDHANQLAHALRGLGVSAGQRVAIVLPTSPQFILSYYATLKAGGVVVLPNPDASASSIIEAARATEAHCLITLQEYEQLAALVKAALPSITIILIDLTEDKRDLENRRRLRKFAHLYDDLVADISADNPAPPTHSTVDDLAAIVFTSGTTDSPKGVCLTHKNLVANAMQTRHWVPDLEYGQEIFLSALPLVHSYGMTTAMNVPIAIGATMILLPKFDLMQVLESIKKYKPTIFPGIPVMYTAINNAPNVRSYGLNTIKACISGASPLPIEVQEAFEKLTRGRLVEGYGLTEASPITHANPLYGTRKVGYIGVPLPNTDAEIVDMQTGHPLPAGYIGELRVRGPQIMRGYWGGTEPNTPSSDAESALRDGWLYTGDIAQCDHDGYFQIVARKKDVILTGEYSVYPRDVEEVLYEHAKVLEAAVVGVSIDSDSQGQQHVKAYVVPRPGTTLSKDELLALCQRRLEPHAVPVDIEFREALPKSFVGKVLRRLLTEKVDSGDS